MRFSYYQKLTARQKRIYDESDAIPAIALYRPEAHRARVTALAEALGDAKGPFIAVTDYVKLIPDMIARWMPRPFVPLGTDGFGMSDTREALRRHFEIDAPSIVVATLDALAHDGKGKPGEVVAAMKAMGSIMPWR